MTEASRCIYTLICSLTRPATYHCPENGLGHLQIVECPNVHMISLQLVIHDYTCEHWLTATEPYDRIPTGIRWFNAFYLYLSVVDMLNTCESEYPLEHEEGKIICASGHSMMCRWSCPFLMCGLAASPGVAMLVCIYADLLIDIFVC